jgi:DNA primase
VDSCGIENVTASCGTSLTEAQVRLLARYCHRVVVNYDPDSAGVAATERSLTALLEAGFEIKVLALPGGLDPDSFICKHGDAEYRRILGVAPGYIDYLTDRSIAQHGLDAPEGKLAVANAVLPYLARIPNAIMRKELTDRLAARTFLDDRLLREELRRAAVERRPEVGKERKLATTHAERKLLRVFLENEKVMDDLLPGLIAEGAFEGLISKGLFGKLHEVRQSGRSVDIHDLSELLNFGDQQLLHEALIYSDEVPSAEDARRYCGALRRRKIQRELSALVPAIGSAGRDRDWERLATLNENKVMLMKELAKIKES